MSRSSRIANKGSACRSLRSGSLDLLEVISAVGVFVSLYFTRSYAALRAADLDWIIRPGYSSGG